MTTTTSAISSTATRLVLDSATEPTRRPAGTWARTASAGSGVAGSSPWCAASNWARNWSAACSGR